jgi:hypothetical protein
MAFFERRQDGELQWVRERSRPEHRTSGAWVRESTRRRSYATVYHEEPVIDSDIASETAIAGIRLKQSLPAIPDIEGLLQLYVATGEGQGAYLAAKKEEERTWGRKGNRYGDRRRRQRYYDNDTPHTSSSGSSDDHSDDEDGRFGGRPPHRPPGGGPAASHPEVYIVRPNARHRPASRRDNRVWIPLQVIEDGEWRFLRAEEYEPGRQEEYRPCYPGPAYINHRPQAIRRPSPAHVVIDDYAELVETLPAGVVPPPPEVPAGPAAYHPGDFIIPGPQHHGDPGREDLPARPPPAYPERLHISRIHRPQRYQDVHRPPRPTVEDALEDEDELQLASLPSEEDDIRMDRNHSLRTVRSRSAKTGRTRRVVIRGGSGTNQNFDADSDGDVHQVVRMRGGGAEKPLSKTSAVGAGVIQDYDIISKHIM